MRSKRVLWVAAMLLLAVSLSGCYAARMVTAPIVVNGRQRHRRRAMSGRLLCRVERCRPDEHQPGSNSLTIG